jgi:hypothetical protein
MGEWQSISEGEDRNRTSGKRNRKTIHPSFLMSVALREKKFLSFPNKWRQLV